MDIHALANSIYVAVRNDSTAVAAIRKEFTTLAQTIATDPAASARVTSATVNGQTFSAQQLMSNGDRLQLLRRVVECFDRKATISRTQITRFP